MTEHASARVAMLLLATTLLLSSAPGGGVLAHDTEEDIRDAICKFRGASTEKA